MAEVLERKQFASPEEEIAYLRERIAARERELLARTPDVSDVERREIGRRELRDYAEHAPEVVLAPRQQLSPDMMRGLSEHVGTARHAVEEVIHIAQEHGVRNALAAAEKIKDPFVVDGVHDALVFHIRGGARVGNFSEREPAWKVLHMTLFSIALPEMSHDAERESDLKVVMGAMEQLCSGLSAIVTGPGDDDLYYAFEIAVADNSDDIVFYAAVPTKHIGLFEKQVLSLFPHAILTEEKNDYNIFVSNGAAACSVGVLKRHPIYPLRLFEHFEHDPLKVVLNAFSKIEREGGGAALQFLIRPRRFAHSTTYQDIIKRLEKGVPLQKALELSTTFGAIKHFFKDEFFPSSEPEKERERPPEIRTDLIEMFKKKVDRPIDEVIIRVVASATTPTRASQILHELESGFHQFEESQGNQLVFTVQKGSAVGRFLKAYAFREWNASHALPLSERELVTLVHIPKGGKELSPQFKQVQAITAPAPMGLPSEGTLLGTNLHRGTKTDVYITPEDRLRHFYIIGQTGTGKTTLMKNMLIQDMRDGAGVCFIDPHGTDIVDVLAAVPPQRVDDLVYFDPSHLDRPLGLNMLEFDPQLPEQKTFVVNELFSIFQKLYGAVPESMGPIFEQYFRNATMLVLEDPASGSTLLDVSRVMADASYRKLKLSRARNPVVIQFWEDIATKAGGEAALENIVPYITSKFDIFTANDYMRPIIGQQTSAFNFRELMDNRKILLVNLAKGRLGEINAHLIGMILVGKILMAALSRADSPGKAFSPFYLHIDEFQNITTDSVASILSEARKYKLGLTIAHQYIEQIGEKIRDAVFGNVGSLAVFRVGSQDAEFLERQFEPTFTKNDLLYIPNRHAYVRLLSRGTPTKPFDIETVAPPRADEAYAAQLIQYARTQFGRSRAEVEEEIAARYRKPSF